MGRLALAIKVPLGTWLLVTDQLLVLTPLFAVLILVSSQTCFSHHLRYVLPIFPFAFIWISRLAREVAGTSGPFKYLVAISIIWSVTSSLWIYPHSMSYFNELVGGPRHGHEHLGGIPHDSNIDSGQDLLYLKRWIAKHPEARPLHIAFNGLYGPELAGIDYQPATPHLQPGWHAISVNRLRSRDGTFDEYLRRQPVDMVGYSIYVYRIESPSQMRN